MTNLIRPQQTDEALQAAAGSISYEIWMLIISGEMLGGAYGSNMTLPGGKEKDMALESFLLHFRNLHVFLCPNGEPVQPDDVIASDFLDEPTSCNVGNAAVLGNDRDRKRLDKMLTHLSYRRCKHNKGEDDLWHVRSMLIAMLGEIETFLSKLQARRLGWFISAEEIVEARDAAHRLLSEPVKGPGSEI